MNENIFQVILKQTTFPPLRVYKFMLNETFESPKTYMNKLKRVNDLLEIIFFDTRNEIRVFIGRI